MHNKVVVRAITYFTGRMRTYKEVVDEVENALKVLDTAEKVLSSSGYEVFTKRLSLSSVSFNEASKLIDLVPRDILVSTGYLKERDLDKLIELAYNGLYTPILHPGEPDTELALIYSDIIHRASSIDPVVATRISIGFHEEDFMTPYFPDSSSRGDRSIGLAFIYGHIVASVLKRNGTLGDAFEAVDRQISDVLWIIREHINLPVHVDLSLSPWMDKSVAEIYELMDCKLNESCVPYYTWLLNKHISSIASHYSAIGFNEVMLPYAEDNILMSYGERGLIRARDFLLYASTCVAGVDMVVIPRDVKRLAYLIASAMALKQAKKRPLSFRAIPVDARPGEVIDLGKFGKVPVLNY